MIFSADWYPTDATIGWELQGAEVILDEPVIPKIQEFKANTGNMYFSALHPKALQDRGDRQAAGHAHDVDQCRPQSVARHHALKLFHRPSRR